MRTGRGFFIVFVTLACIVSAGFAAPAAAGMKGPKYRLAVVEFRDEFSGVSTTASGTGSARTDAVNAYSNVVNRSYPGAGAKTIGAGASKMLETELAKSGMFDVFTRAEMKHVLKEQALGQKGMVTAQSAAKTGRLIGVNVVVVGAVTEFGESVGGVSVWGLAGGKKSTARVVIDVQLIDTTSGKIHKALSAEGREGHSGVSIFGIGGGMSLDDTKIGKAMRRAIDKLVKELSVEMTKIPWTAKVVKVKGSTVYMNVGVNSNIQPGTKFLVYSAGEELIDPDTGESLGTEETLAGEVMATQVLKKITKATVVSGTGFSRGDVIRLK